MRKLAESGRRPEPTPRAYRGECVTGQAPCYAEMRKVSQRCARCLRDAQEWASSQDVLSQLYILRAGSLRGACPQPGNTSSSSTHQASSAPPGSSTPCSSSPHSPSAACPHPGTTSSGATPRAPWTREAHWWPGAWCRHWWYRAGDTHLGASARSRNRTHRVVKVHWRTGCV